MLQLKKNYCGGCKRITRKIEFKLIECVKNNKNRHNVEIFFLVNVAAFTNFIDVFDDMESPNEKLERKYILRLAYYFLI